MKKNYISSIMSPYYFNGKKSWNLKKILQQSWLKNRKKISKLYLYFTHWKNTVKLRFPRYILFPHCKLCFKILLGAKNIILLTFTKFCVIREICINIVTTINNNNEKCMAITEKCPVFLGVFLLNFDCFEQ